MTYSTSDIREAILKKGVTYIPHHSCSICDAELYYSVDNNELFFNSACDCTTRHSAPQKRDWTELTNWINMNSDEETRKRLIILFGLETIKENKSNSKKISTFKDFPNDFKDDDVFTLKPQLPIEMIWQPKEDITAFELANCLKYLFRYNIMPWEINTSELYLRHFKIIDHNNGE